MFTVAAVGLLVRWSSGTAEAGGADLDASLRAAVETAFAGQATRVRVACYLNPCALTGDFDGDGKADQAVLVSDPKNRRGVAVLFGSGASALLGAGHAIGNGGDDFEWAETWKLVPRGSALQRSRPKQAGDALMITSESGGGLLSWSRSGFVWTQWGD